VDEIPNYQTGDFRTRVWILPVLLAENGGVEPSKGSEGEYCERHSASDAGWNVRRFGYRRYVVC
jgi:hypothetical protein